MVWASRLAWVDRDRTPARDPAEPPLVRSRRARRGSSARRLSAGARARRRPCRRRQNCRDGGLSRTDRFGMPRSRGIDAAYAFAFRRRGARVRVLCVRDARLLQRDVRRGRVGPRRARTRRGGVVGSRRRRTPRRPGAIRPRDRHLAGARRRRPDRASALRVSSGESAPNRGDRARRRRIRRAVGRPTVALLGRGESLRIETAAQRDRPRARARRPQGAPHPTHRTRTPGPSATALTESPRRTHTGPSGPRTPWLAGSPLIARTAPAPSTRRPTTGAGASKATRTQVSRCSARTISTLSAVLSRRAISRMPGATAGARARSPSKPAVRTGAVAPAPAVGFPAELRAVEGSERAAAPHAQASSTKGSASRTRSVRRGGGEGLACDLSIDRVHPTRALELDSAIDEDRRRVQVAQDLTGCVHLDRRPRANVSVNRAAAHDDRRDVDLGMNLGPLPDDEGVVAPDLPLENAVDPDAPLEVKLAFELRAAAEEGGDLGSRELRFHACCLVPTTKTICGGSRPRAFLRRSRWATAAVFSCPRWRARCSSPGGRRLKRASKRTCRTRFGPTSTIAIEAPTRFAAPWRSSSRASRPKRRRSD